MSLKNSINAIPLTSRDSATVNNTLQRLSADAGLPGACVILRIVNDSNVTIGVSYDGVTFNDSVRSGSDLQLYFQTNSQPGNFVACMPKGTKVYVIGAAAGAGFVYLTGYYQQEGY